MYQYSASSLRALGRFLMPWTWALWWCQRVHERAGRLLRRVIGVQRHQEHPAVPRDREVLHPEGVGVLKDN